MAYKMIFRCWRIGFTVGEIIEIHDSKRIPLSRCQIERRWRKKDLSLLWCSLSHGFVDNYIFDGKYLLLGEDGTVVDDANTYSAICVGDNSG